MRVHAETSGDGARTALASDARRRAGGWLGTGRQEKHTGRRPRAREYLSARAACGLILVCLRGQEQDPPQVLALQRPSAPRATGSSEGGRRRRRLKRSRAPNPHREGAPASKNHGIAAAVRPRPPPPLLLLLPPPPPPPSEAAAPPPPALPQAHLSWHPGPPLRKWNITSLFSEFLFLGAVLTKMAGACPSFAASHPRCTRKSSSFSVSTMCASCSTWRVALPSCAT